MLRVARFIALVAPCVALRGPSDSRTSRISPRCFSSPDAIPEKLQSRISEYLALRKATGPAEEAKDATSPVLDFLSIQPVSKKRRAEAASRGAPDILSYGELHRLGFSDLIDPILDMGGYVKVSKILGIETTPSPVKVKVELSLLGPEETPGVSLGSSLEERLSEAAFKKGREAGSSGDIKARQGMPVAPSIIANVKVKSENDDNEEQLTRIIQPFELSALQRTYAIFAAAIISLGWGHASADAVARDMISSAIPDICRDISAGIIVGNVLSAVLSIRNAIEKQRQVPLWVFKSILAGPASFFELQTLGPIENED